MSKKQEKRDEPKAVEEPENVQPSEPTAENRTPFAPIYAPLPEQVPDISQPDQLIRVTIALPQRVLYALIDPSHVDADSVGAYRYGLFSGRTFEGLMTFQVTELGKLILASADTAALYHRMYPGGAK